MAKREGSLGGGVGESLIPFMNAQPSGPNHLPKALSLHTVTVGVRISTSELWGNGNVQSIVYAVSVTCTLDFKDLV